jgi:hypothetical protein
MEQCDGVLGRSSVMEWWSLLGSLPSSRSSSNHAVPMQRDLRCDGKRGLQTLKTALRYPENFTIICIRNLQLQVMY